MKKLLLMIFVVVCLLCGVIVEENTINNYLSEIEQKTEYIIKLSSGKDNIQTQQIKNAVRDLKDTWLHHEKILATFANHKDMRDLCIEIQKLEANIEVNQYEDFTAGLKVILHLSEDYKFILGTSWQNIF